MTKRLLPAALLASTAASAAQIVVSHRHHRERMRLATAQMHQELLADQTEDLSLARIWTHLDGVDEEESRVLLHCNRWMTLWSLMFRMRVMPPRVLQETVHDFLSTSVGRQFWEKARGHRSDTARDATDERFNALINQAYDEATPAPASG